MSKYVGTGPLSYEKRIYRAGVLQGLRNTDSTLSASSKHSAKKLCPPIHIACTELQVRNDFHSRTS